VLCVGLDWAEDHHDVAVLDEGGRVVTARRVAEGLAGLTALHELLAGLAADPAEVVVGTETDRGLFVGALVAAGYQVYAVNPLQVSRYRDRHRVSGAKSDPGTPRSWLAWSGPTGTITARWLATPSWPRRSRCWPAPTRAWSGPADASSTSSAACCGSSTRGAGRLRRRPWWPRCLAVLNWPDPNPGPAALTGQAGRDPGPRRPPTRRPGTGGAAPSRPACPQLQAPTIVADAYGAAVLALVGVISTLNRQLEQLERHFEIHPDAEIVRRLPGLGVVLGARVVAEFGDDPTRYANPTARKNYAGTAPITRASGKRRVVVARLARNRRLADACYLWAFSALTASPGARGYYDRRRAAGTTHQQALRALANRLVGILHGCLRHHRLYNELQAWPATTQHAA
jgi:transposase